MWIERQTGKTVLGQYRDNRACFSKLDLAITTFRPDVIYIRNCYYHPRLGNILRKYPSILELNSLWLQESWLHRKATFRRRLLYYHLLLTRKLFYKAVKGAVAVTHEIRDKELKACLPRLPVKVIPNSIAVPNVTDRSLKGNSSVPKIVFAAGPLPVPAAQNYHGVDKIYRVAANTIGRLEFVLIGESQFYPKSKPSNIRLTGKLGHKEMRRVIADCDVGLGTVGLHRKGMEEACPLKVREYVAQGLPVILPYKDTAFWDEVPSWVLEIPNSENNLENAIDEIETFCREMIGKDVPREDAENFFGAAHLEKARVKFMASISEVAITEDI